MRRKVLLWTSIMGVIHCVIGISAVWAASGEGLLKTLGNTLVDGIIVADLPCLFLPGLLFGLPWDGGGLIYYFTLIAFGTIQWGLITAILALLVHWRKRRDA